MWKISVFIFTLSRRQSQVERGFNIKKSTLQEISCWKKNYGTLIGSGKSADDFVITSELTVNCKSAYSNYDNDLTKKKENTFTTKNNKKRKAVFEEITELKRQKMSLENCSEKMRKDANKYLTDAEENKDVQLLTTGNELQNAITTFKI